MKTLAGFLGISGVALGAAGAHALKGRLVAAGMNDTWQTAVNYHLVHTIAVFALACLTATSCTPDARLKWAGRAWALGVILFSGSLYLLALGGPRWLGPITPLGGLALIAGWACVLASGLRPSGNALR